MTAQETVGYMVASYRYGSSLWWSEKDGTLYVSKQTTAFKTRRQAKRAIKRAEAYWKQQAALLQFSYKEPQYHVVRVVR